MFDLICAEQGTLILTMASTQLLQKFILTPHFSWNCWLWVCGTSNLYYLYCILFKSSQYRDLQPGSGFLTEQCLSWPLIPFLPLFKAIQINAVGEFCIPAASLKSCWTTLVFGISQIGDFFIFFPRELLWVMLCISAPSFSLVKSAWSWYFFNGFRDLLQKDLCFLSLIWVELVLSAP